MEHSDASSEYGLLPEDEIKHLSEELQIHIHEMMSKSTIALEIAEEKLGIIYHYARAFSTTGNLRYIHHRLISTKFEPNMESVLENEMLTLAFVTTYARLFNKGGGKVVGPDNLPTELRPVHEKIMELRNQRYAHNGEHSSKTEELDIGFDGENFVVNVNQIIRFHVGGDPAWKQLVEFLDCLVVDKFQRFLKELEKLTGFKWIFPSGPPPAWVANKSDDHAPGTISSDSCSG